MDEAEPLSRKDAMRTLERILNLGSIGQCRLGARLAAGGSANVYRGVVQSTVEGWTGTREVVLKIPNEATLTDPQRLSAFVAEMNLLKGLSHPGIVRLLMNEVEQGIPIQVLEYVGEPLRRVLPQWVVQRVPADYVFAAVAGAARALFYLSEQGWTHLDVCLDNLLVRPNGELVLIDLGSAVRTGPSGATRPMLYGKPRYTAPEAMRSGRIGPKADVFSLGVVLYQLCAGGDPFPEMRTRSDWALRVTDSDLVDPEVRNPLLSRVPRLGLMLRTMLVFDELFRLDMATVPIQLDNLRVEGGRRVTSLYGDRSGLAEGVEPTATNSDVDSGTVSNSRASTAGPPVIAGALTNPANAMGPGSSEDGKVPERSGPQPVNPPDYSEAADRQSGRQVGPRPGVISARDELWYGRDDRDRMEGVNSDPPRGQVESGGMSVMAKSLILLGLVLGLLLPAVALLLLVR